VLGLLAGDPSECGSQPCGLSLAPRRLLARRLERQARLRAWERARSAQSTQDLARARQAAARVEEHRPVTPSTIALPAEEESVSRFPDHYDG